MGTAARDTDWVTWSEATPAGVVEILVGDPSRIEIAPMYSPRDSADAADGRSYVGGECVYTTASLRRVRNPTRERIPGT